jgi:hypothetical protein
MRFAERFNNHAAALKTDARHHANAMMRVIPGHNVLTYRTSTDTG